ncbi:MAG: hypothetical protein ACRD32_07375 [Nitrososphaerales archaeon]
MSTITKFPVSGIGFGLSHIDHITIGNILTTISVVALLAVLLFVFYRSRPQGYKATT